MATWCIEMKEAPVEEVHRKSGFLNPSNADGYLKGSHFAIGQDQRLNENCLQTAYKYDYPPWPMDGRAPPIPHIATEKLLPGDDRYLPEQNMTETKAEYTEKPLGTKANIEEFKQRLGGTHYKQHKDDRAPAWESSHKIDFVPRPMDRQVRSKRLDESNLIFGDPGKAENPVTAYNQAYKDFSADQKKPEAVRMPKGPPTILGDTRATTYSTTQKEHFVPKKADSATALIIRPTVDLFGTRGKPFEGKSEFKDKYVEVKADRQAVIGHRGHETTFQQSHGPGLDEWDTTHKLAYVPRDLQGVSKVVKDSNASNVPLGGKTPGEEMISNYQRNYLEWQPRPNDASTIDLYKSKVVFGDPAQEKDYYETTHTATYVPFGASRPAKANKELRQSNLPIDNWGAEVNIPEYNDRYQYSGPGDKGKRDRLDLLTKAGRSNLQFPVDGELRWRTTHKSHFVPKRAQSEKLYDKQRFQNSNIAFGDPRIDAFKDNCF